MIDPPLADGRVSIRTIRVRDSRTVEQALLADRAWLQRWEASSPDGARAFDVRGSIRSLLQQERAGTGLPLVMQVDGRFAGQLNVSGITYGSLASASLGYWVTRASAGQGVTPTAVALATDLCFARGLHRMEICIRPENAPSLRVVTKLGFRYEGLRRRYIHIDGDWRDHFAFALVSEEVGEGVLRRWREGRVPPENARIPAEDIAAAARPIRYSPFV
ncbi:GNAT family N-acetyltransferase [Mycetocola reblochoni]|uniref:Ribosomal-protein-S5p-alanine acetyltransferase n=2 Tax=Mycetocola reblochoni TaxID=331618 RepID=A0A1R4IPU1_9MICO|nr:GNAT family protein [Mycetocola reblochoni]RLP68422.1 N-acetyltransferase [Mycetocola reblochoni]SJN21872.1 Ribosomal-protein-S5p-alanine acetyltransferase [Mycetocola reblochoni REB411]